MWYGLPACDSTGNGPARSRVPVPNVSTIFFRRTNYCDAIEMNPPFFGAHKWDLSPAVACGGIARRSGRGTSSKRCYASSPVDA